MPANPFSFLDPDSNQEAFTTALVYDRACELHESSDAHPECPDRVKLPLKHLRYCGLINKFFWLGKVEPCSRERLALAHDEAYVDHMLEKLKKYEALVLDSEDSQDILSKDDVTALLDGCFDNYTRQKENDIQESDLVNGDRPSEIIHLKTESVSVKSEEFPSEIDEDSESTPCAQDIYFNEYTHQAVLHAAGGAVQAALSIACGTVNNALCLLRPPGHHASRNNASGFCIFNNVAIAARALQKDTENVKRVVIFDWDVHHGDGTEKIFYDDPSVLCISIHQYARGHPHRFHRRSTQYRMEDTYRMLTKEGFTDNIPLEEQKNEETVDSNVVVSNGAQKEEVEPIPNENQPPVSFQGSKRSRREHASIDYAQLEVNLRQEVVNDNVFPEKSRHGEFATFISDPSRTILGDASADEEEEDDSYNPEDYEELSDSSFSESDCYYDSSTPDFYPGSGHIEDIGCDQGKGYNVNIPLPCHGFGDLEYCAIMDSLVLPLIRDFDADFIIIAGGFDAVRHDTLGSMQLTPSGYAMMTKQLMDALPHGRVLCVLEGGYNVPQVSLCVEAVARTLLGSVGTEHSRLLLHRSVSVVRDVREKIASDRLKSEDQSASKRAKPESLQIRKGSF